MTLIHNTFDVIKSSKVKGIFQMAVKGPISWRQSNLWDNYGLSTGYFDGVTKRTSGTREKASHQGYFITHLS